jgi:hypothetical protein
MTSIRKLLSFFHQQTPCIICTKDNVMHRRLRTLYVLLKELAALYLLEAPIHALDAFSGLEGTCVGSIFESKDMQKAGSF